MAVFLKLVYVFMRWILVAKYKSFRYTNCNGTFLDL